MDQFTQETKIILIVYLQNMNLEIMTQFSKKKLFLLRKKRFSAEV